MGSSEPPQISMLCRANGEESVKVHLDEPLILSVSIVNDAAVQAASYNSPLRDKLQELERKHNAKQIGEEQFKRAAEEIERKMLKARTYRFGGPTGWTHFIKFQVFAEDAWRDADWPLWLLEYYPADQVADLDDSTSCYVEFGIDPEDAKRPHGEFQIKAVVDVVKGETFESDVVTVIFLRQEMPENGRNREENLFAKAEYYYKRGLHDDARELVQRILKVNPSSIESLDLLGDIEESVGNFSAALSAFEKASQEIDKKYPDIDEPPDTLLSKISKLQALLEE